MTMTTSCCRRYVISRQHTSSRQDVSWSLSVNTSMDNGHACSVPELWAGVDQEDNVSDAAAEEDVDDLMVTYLHTR